LSSTVAPAPSKASLALSASSFEAPVKMSDGAPSTSSLASLSPRLVKPLTSLMTWIFCDPASARTTSKK
jgi:hypothetical protein